MDKETKEFFENNYIHIVYINNSSAENPICFKTGLARYLGMNEDNTGLNEIVYSGIMIFIHSDEEYVISYSDNHVEEYCSEKEKVIISADKLDCEELAEKVLNTIKCYFEVSVELL